MSQIQRKINQAALRIQQLRSRNKNNRNLIVKNRELANNILLKKHALALQLIQNEKKNQKLTQIKQQGLLLQKQKNSLQRKKHRQQIRDILIAMHLIKAEDASEIRKISKQHQLMIRQHSNSLLQTNQKNKMRVQSSQGKLQSAYWKDRLYVLHCQSQRMKTEKERDIQIKNQQLLSLLEKARSMDEHLKETQIDVEKSKRQYFNAVNLPIREVVSALHCYQEVINPEQSYRIKSKLGSKQSHSKNEQKLKIVLQKLKKKQKQEIRLLKSNSQMA